MVREEILVEMARQEKRRQEKARQEKEEIITVMREE